MRNAIRCCISCILPCGALDVVRIVHVNGRVEEISGAIRAEEVMKAHPKHVLKKPTSQPTSDVEALNPHPGGPTIVVVPPDAQLQRGKIYFLIPVHDQPPSKKKKSSSSSSSKKSLTSSSSLSLSSSCSSSLQSISPAGSGALMTTARKKRKEQKNSISLATANLVLSSKDGDKYLSDILSEKVISSPKERRRGRVTVWRPRLESIIETLSEAGSNDQL